MIVVFCFLCLCWGYPATLKGWRHVSFYTAKFQKQGWVLQSLLTSSQGEAAEVGGMRTMVVVTLMRMVVPEVTMANIHSGKLQPHPPSSPQYQHYNCHHHHYQGPGVHLTHLSRRSPGHPLPKVLPCWADDVDVLMNSSFLDRFWIWGQIVQLEFVSWMGP